MADPHPRKRMTGATKAQQRATSHIRAGRGVSAEQRLTEELRQVGRELLEEPVPQRLLDILQAEEDRQE